jgi:hyperosmotically inducible protein
MNLRTTLCSLLIPALFALGLSACEQGPAERAGERVDRAADRAGDSLERAGDRAQDRTNR